MAVRSPEGRKAKRTRARQLYFIFAFVTFWSLIFSILSTSRVRFEPTTSFLAPYSILAGLTNDILSSRAKRVRPQYHMIFSSGCTEQQHWESYVFFYHAFKVQQPGNVTRLVSGCTEVQERKLRQFHREKIQTMSDRFHVFFTPEFGKLLKNEEADYGSGYKYLNKPHSVFLWMKDTLGMGQSNTAKEVEDGIVLLLDPDMVLLRPLLADFSQQDMIYASAAKKGAMRPYGNGTMFVRHGQPMAQQDGYLANEWMKFNLSYITQGGAIPPIDPKDGLLTWNSGPPYLFTVRDGFKMASLWKEYVPRVFEEYPELFAEMFGLVIAAVHLNLPHVLVKSIAVSNTDTRDREGWAFVDALPDDEVCAVEKWGSNPKMPIVLHYCQRYLLGRFFFSKYRLKKKFISCDTALLTMPPMDAHQIYDYAIRPPPDKGHTHPHEEFKLTQTKAKREAFMLCGMIHSVNEAARYFKLHHCNGTGNFSEVYNFHDDPYS